jgi:hypothetical protein
MNTPLGFLIVARVVTPMPVAPLIGLVFAIAVERVEVLEAEPGGPRPGDLVPVGHANAPADEAYRRIGAVHRMRVRRPLPPDATVWSDFPVADAEVWFCVERLDPAMAGGPR